MKNFTLLEKSKGKGKMRAGTGSMEWGLRAEVHSGCEQGLSKLMMEGLRGGKGA